MHACFSIRYSLHVVQMQDKTSKSRTQSKADAHHLIKLSIVPQVPKGTPSDIHSFGEPTLADHMRQSRSCGSRSIPACRGIRIRVSKYQCYS